VEVSLASRTAETGVEAPAATFVITREDIRRSGARRLYDLFRQAPGVDVIETSAYTAAVQARGLACQYARQMLVQVDGRIVYTPQIGNVNWDLVPVFLDDIERIEIVRGPANTLHGANAMNGVINIITTDPARSAAPESRLVLRGGNLGYYSGAATQAGSRDEHGVAWRVSAGYEESRGYEDPLPDAYTNPRLTFRVSRGDPEASRLEVLGGYWGGSRATDGFGPKIHRLAEDRFAQARVQRAAGDRRLTAGYWIHALDSSGSFGGPDDLLKQAAEVEGTFRHGGHRLVIGLDLRHSHVQHSDLAAGEPVAASSGRLFAADTFHPVPALAVHFGAMVETHSFVRPALSPRLNLGWAVRERHHLRAALAQAHRLPAFYEEQLTLALPPGFSPGAPALQLAGNDRVRAERCWAKEAGWWWQAKPGVVTVNLEAYENRYDDLIDLSATPEVVPQPDSTIALRYTICNRAAARARGVELELALVPAPQLATQVTYTYQDMADPVFVRLAPRHKGSVLVRGRLPFGAEGQAFYRLTSAYEATALFMDRPTAAIDTHHRLDVRIARRLGHATEVAVSGLDLLADDYAESAFTTIDRSVFLELRTRF
jgi:iron complex outermembrane receptor protein